MTVVATFEVRAWSDPQTVLRLAGLLAQLGLHPEEIHVRRSEDAMTMRIVQDGIGATKAAIVAEKMRASVLVDSVALSCRSRDMRVSDSCPA